MAAVASGVEREFDARGMRRVIAAAAAGTVIEWYDFFLFGVLAKTVAPHFFPSGDPTAAFLSTLATFATGFVVRPFGAVVFGRLGDVVGRKYAFLVTLLVMGGGTALIGVVPDYRSIGVFAPLVLLALRLLQGLAIGGEYGGAVIYVAEHAPESRRGRYASFVQVTATAGLIVALAAILVTRRALGDDRFDRWGWRLPFFASVLLVGFSLWIRVRMAESPIFERLKSSGRTSRAPVAESLGSRRNWKLMLLTLFAVTAGQGVVWYTAHFTAFYFLQSPLGLDLAGTARVFGPALLCAAPFFVVFGALSDRFGRRRVMWLGHALVLVTWVPIYLGLDHFGRAAPRNEPTLALLLFVQLLIATMVNGPIPALIVELFPARIRYTSLSLPYHVGNGVFGGLTPYVGAALVAKTGHPLSGLWFPLVVSAATLVVGWFALPETRHVSLWKEVESPSVDSL